MNSEIHIVIVWEKGLDKVEAILFDLKNDFQILEVNKVVWSEYHFSNNLSRFYGQKLPSGSFKEKHCGKGPFYTIIIRQNNPIYKFRKTSKGKEKVNSILFDKKQLYRKWTGGGHKVHTSNSEEESFHDIYFLFDKTSDSFLGAKDWDGQIKKIEINIKGFDGWSNFKKFFHFLNLSSNYVLLRNYEDLENLPSKSDIDILTSDVDFSFHINGSKKHRYNNRVAYEISVDEKKYDVDVRIPGDGYYDPSWCHDILKNKILYKEKFYIPDPINEFYSLLYHVLIHKNEFNNKYDNRLIQLSEKLDIKFSPSLFEDRQKMMNLLEVFLSKRKYNITRPSDFSVQYSHGRKGIKRSVWEMIGRIKNG
ncbi:MAG: hypothetical protein CMG11_03615 [Candidatus Marinimicrobia bacterium]|nr:hypothetical protein [Candidatus Neomarinimicrobiota bacterium]|tara:strand:+ start:598 stop:1689 length:1092 start_codon:yes stop_codon:yes gene_type:complete